MRAVSVPAAVLPFEKGLLQRAFVAESVFSSPITSGSRHARVTFLDVRALFQLHFATKICDQTTPFRPYHPSTLLDAWSRVPICIRRPRTPSPSTPTLIHLLLRSIFGSRRLGTDEESKVCSPILLGS